MFLAKDAQAHVLAQGDVGRWSVLGAAWRDVIWLVMRASACTLTIHQVCAKLLDIAMLHDEGHIAPAGQEAAECKHSSDNSMVHAGARGAGDSAYLSYSCTQ